MSGAVPERQTPDLGLSTNPTPVELKPCPFCQSTTAELLFAPCSTPIAYVQCHECGANGADFAEEHEGDTQYAAKAIAAWNTRPHASAAPVDELVEILGRGLPDDPRLDRMTTMTHGCEHLRVARDQLTVYARRVAELEGALRPFADAYTASEPYRDFDGRDCREGYVINAVGLGDFESARAALTGEQG